MHFRHPTDEQLRCVDIHFLATNIICSLSTLNCHWFCLLYKKDDKNSNKVKALSWETGYEGHKLAGSVVTDCQDGGSG